MKPGKLDRAELVKELMLMRDRIDAAVDLLVTNDEDDGECEHPYQEVEDASEELGEAKFKCKRCGEVWTEDSTH